MKLCLSTSGPFVGVAWFDENRELAFREILPAQRNASEAVVQLLERSGIPSNQCSSIVCDIGPGSFTGVRVGVTMAKIIADQQQIPLYAITAFDLFATGAVAIPGKPGSYYLRDSLGTLTAQCSANRAEASGALLVNDDSWPTIWREFPQEGLLRGVPAAELVPLYIAEPGISVAKQRHIMGETVGDRP